MNRKLNDFIIENGTFDKMMRVVHLPLTAAVIAFTCNVCKVEDTFLLFPDKIPDDSFGRCKKCNQRMSPKEIIIDWQSFVKKSGVELTREEIKDKIKFK